MTHYNFKESSIEDSMSYELSKLEKNLEEKEGEERSFASQTVNLRPSFSFSRDYSFSEESYED
eukprot:SAG22_NODE_2_length_61565_cov_858.782010_22_plen_63_part_00